MSNANSIPPATSPNIKQGSVASPGPAYIHAYVGSVQGQPGPVQHVLLQSPKPGATNSGSGATLLQASPQPQSAPPTIAPKPSPVQSKPTSSPSQGQNSVYSQGIYVDGNKSQSYVPASSEQKTGDIGYVSNVNSKPRRVRAVTASIPVATESLQKFHTVQGGKPATPSSHQKSFQPLSPSGNTVSTQQPTFVASPLITTPSSQPIREQSHDYQPARPSPLVLAPPPAKFSERRRSSETSEKDQKLDDKGQEVSDSDTESRGRACKGKRYKEIIAENGLKSLKKERKPYRGGNQESVDDRDRERSQPSVSFELDSSPSVTQYQGGNENQSEQTVSQSKPPLSADKPRHRPPPLPSTGSLSVPGQGTSMPSPMPSPGLNSPRKSIFKKSIDDGMDEVLEKVNFEKRFEALPQFNPERTDTDSPLPQSPRGIIVSYKNKKRKISSLAKPDTIDGSSEPTSSEANTPRTPHPSTPHAPLGSHPASHPATPHTPHTPKTPRSSRFEDNQFFGSNFSLDTLADAAIGRPGVDGYTDGDLQSPMTPKTPGSPGQFSSLRRILDQRRQLVMQLFDENGLFPSAQATASFQAKYQDIFPTKSCLQLKIREVRQKMMAQSAAVEAAVSEHRSQSGESGGITPATSGMDTNTQNYGGSQSMMSGGQVPASSSG